MRFFIYSLQIIVFLSIGLLYGCSTSLKQEIEVVETAPTTEERAEELRQLLAVQQDGEIENESVTVTLEDDQETINISFENNILFDFDKYQIK